ncbi:pyridoxamine-phosphate oxidase [Friedmanniomyces endolithicus]|nr:pyridoxamine-phosphate oxidase [Friedmanniomyces endolithicus]
MSALTQPTRRILNPSGTNDSVQAQQYTKGELNIDQLHADPIKQFDIWFQHAQDEKVHQPETVTLSTAELPSGRVSARMVYLKEADARGFVIYSNWGTSRKSTDVASNPQAALTFWWHELERQVRIEGPCERMESEESQVYYDTRIRGSRVGAWASQQSKVLRDRAELEGQVADVERRFEGEEKIPVPEFWGGLRSVIPSFRKAWHLGVREGLAGAASISCREYPTSSSPEEAGGVGELCVGGRSFIGGEGPPYMRRPSD